jgi:hypothetical protein
MIKSEQATTGTRKGKARAGNARAARRSVESKLHELALRLREISDLGAAGALLSWDQATYMPKGGAGARARQSAALRKLAHEKSIEPSLGRLIDELAPYADSLSHDSDDASLVRVAGATSRRQSGCPPIMSHAPASWSQRPMMPGRGHGRRTILQPCCRSWKRRST